MIKTNHNFECTLVAPAWSTGAPTVSVKGSAIADTVDDKYSLLTTDGQLDEVAEIVAEFERLRGGGKHASKVRRFMDKTKPLIKLIQRHGKAIDVASNLSPQFLTPLWVSLRIIMKIAIGFDEYFSRLEDILQRLGDVLPRYQVYGELFANHEKVQVAIFQVYRVVTAFVDHARTVFQSTGRVFRKSVWKEFDEEFEDTLNDLRRLSETVEDEVQTAHMIEESIARKKLTQSLAELSCVRAELRELNYAIREGVQVPSPTGVRTWLGARQCHEERTTLDSKRLMTSCRWVLNHPSLLEWTHQQDAQILWVSGPPGCGKSFIYSKVLNHVEESGCTPLVYFLFCTADRERTTISSLLRSWTFQLIKLIWMSNEYPVAWERTKRHLACRTTEEARPADVSQLLLSILEAEDMPSCFLAVDAIDECEDSQDFLRFTHKIPKRFKILVTSRDPPDIDPNLTPQFRTLAVTPELTQQDIDHYLHDAVASLQTLDGNPLPAHIQNQIKDRLRDSNGMFLWIRLMIEDIQTQTTLDEITHCLTQPPPTLTKRYERIMTTTITHQPPPHRLLARKVFFWLLTARQPLTAKEFCAAQAIRLGPSISNRSPTGTTTTTGTTNGTGTTISPSRRLASTDPKTTIQRVCGALVRPRGETGLLYPFHATVTQYLAEYAQQTGLAGEMAAFYGLGPYVVDAGADGVAAAVCMGYLASEAVAALQEKVFGAEGGEGGAGVDANAVAVEGVWSAVAGEPQFDFLRYAVTHWFHHARCIGEGDRELLGMAAELLDGKYPNAGVVWRLYWFSDPERARMPGGCPTAFSGLHMAAYFGLERVVKDLLQTQSFEVVDGLGKSPLWWAAARGHTAVVRVFIDAGAGVEEVERSVGGGGPVLCI